jgi:hypothetical protein
VLVCNAGSEIWYAATSGGSSSSSSSSAAATQWREDLDFERHLEHCWDKAPLKRVRAISMACLPA